jgi:hypothetical protein
MAIILDGTNGITFPSGSVQNNAVANNAAITALVGSRGLSPSIAPAGSILQAVNSTYSTSVNSQSNTFVTSGLSASITPLFSTSKVLVFVSINIERDTVSTGASFQLWRNGSNIQQIGYGVGITGFGNNSYTSFATQWLDSPASTSSQTYTLYFNNTANAGYVNVTNAGANSPAVMTLLEIAQ